MLITTELLDIGPPSYQTVFSDYLHNIEYFSLNVLNSLRKEIILSGKDLITRSCHLVSNSNLVAWFSFLCLIAKGYIKVRVLVQTLFYSGIRMFK